MGYDVMIRIGRFPVQTPLATQPGLGTQPCYKAACDLLVEIVKNAVINFGLVRLSPWEWSKVGHGAAK